MLSIPLTLAFFAGTALAQTSLYIPGLDSQPLIADILGVDGEGRTTWALHQGPLTDPSDGGLRGTATLVEGPNDASFTYVPPGGIFTMGTECSLSGNLAICSATVSGEAVTETETASRILVEAGTTAAFNTPTGNANTATGAPSQPTSAPNNPSQTSQKSSSAPNPSSTSNSGNTLVPLLSGLFISAATVAMCLQF